MHVDMGRLTTQIALQINSLMECMDIVDALYNTLPLLEKLDVTSLQKSTNQLLEPVKQLLEPIKQLHSHLNDFKIFHHCAAITRLYSAYETFIDKLVGEYLEQLPKLYPAYVDLPEALRTQNRNAIGKILQKWGKESWQYSQLTEKSLVEGLSKGVSGEADYYLLSHAFLIESNNYRAHVIEKIFHGIGIDKPIEYVQRSMKMQELMQSSLYFGDSIDVILNQIVSYRNNFSHSEPDNLISPKILNFYMQFLNIFCEILRERLDSELISRRISQGIGIKKYGVIIKRFKDNIVGVKGIMQTTIHENDNVVLWSNQRGLWGKIKSIELNHKTKKQLRVSSDTVFSLRLDIKAKEGNELYEFSDI